MGTPRQLLLMCSISDAPLSSFRAFKNIAPVRSDRRRCEKQRLYEHPSKEPRPTGRDRAIRKLSRVQSLLADEPKVVRDKDLLSDEEAQ
jgi:hypothetical protein